MDQSPPVGDALAARFETHRPHVHAVARRLLGSAADAEDAVQETWLRLQRAEAEARGGIDNLAGWLTTVVARVALNMLRGRRAVPEDPDDLADLADLAGADAGSGADAAEDPEDTAVLADTVGAALLVVLDTLAPSERLAFVLHDLFGMPFDEVATIVDRSPTAARQLASRARRRVRGAAESDGAAGEVARRSQVVAAFLAASREGDFGALLQLLDPDVVLRADAAAVASATANRGRGAPELVAATSGADAVARVFAGRARVATVALLDGVPGAAYAPGGTPYSLFRLEVTDGRITAVEVVADRETIAGTDVVLLG